MIVVEFVRICGLSCERYSKMGSNVVECGRVTSYPYQQKIKLYPSDSQNKHLHPGHCSKHPEKSRCHITFINILPLTPKTKIKNNEIYHF